MKRLMLIAALGLMHTAALAAGAEASQTPTATNGDDDKIICRKTLETGSLVRKTKQCFTKTEWDRIYAATREGNQKVADQLSGGFNCMATGTC